MTDEINAEKEVDNWFLETQSTSISSRPSIISSTNTTTAIKQPEFDPLTEHRWFCPWAVGNINFPKTNKLAQVNLIEFQLQQEKNAVAGWKVCLHSFSKKQGLFAQNTPTAANRKDPLTTVRRILNS